MNLKKKTLLVSLFVLFAGIGFLTAASGNTDRSEVKYQWEAQEVVFQNMGVNMMATLTTPKINRSRPIVLILHGYGGERKGLPVEGTGEGYFERYARVLAERGYCSLRFDFRGSGESIGGGGYEVTSFSGQVTDAVAALNFIETLPDPVDPKRIAVTGHSQGGLVTSMLAAQDNRVDTVVLWGATCEPAHDYEGLLLRDGMKQGLALPDGGSITLPLYVDGTYILDMTMGKQFFVEIFSTDPLLAMKDYKGPVLYVSGIQDVVVWPQPIVGWNFLNAHEGYEKLVAIDMGHNFDYFIGPEKLDQQIDVTIDWIKETLRK